MSGCTIVSGPVDSSSSEPRRHTAFLSPGDWTVTPSRFAHVVREGYAQVESVARTHPSTLGRCLDRSSDSIRTPIHLHAPVCRHGFPPHFTRGITLERHGGFVDVVLGAR